jgi:hypothetical protein
MPITSSCLASQSVSSTVTLFQTRTQGTVQWDSLV